MAEYFPIDVSLFGSYSGSFSGSFFGNGSKLTGITASFFSGSVSNAISASYAATASVLLGSVTSASYAATASYVNPLVQDVIITGSLINNGLTYPSADNGEFSFMQTDGNGNLSLQYVNTLYEVIYNGEATQLAKGTPVYISGSQGANSKAYRADAGNPLKMPVVYVTADNIDASSTGRAIALGLITGVDTTGYPGGTEIYVGVGGGWTSSRPTGSAIVQVLGYVTKEGNGGQGVILNPGPANLPNLPSGSVWVGNSGSIPVAVLTSSLRVATASYALTASFISTASTNAFVQGGNSFGTTALLGTNDNQSLAFETSGSVRVFVSSSGNVGIGTTTPLVPLQLNHNNSSNDTNVSTYPLRIRNNAWAVGQLSGLEFWNGDQKSVATSRIISQMQGNGGGGEQLLFQTQPSSVTNPNPNQPTTKMAIFNDGNVGIGTGTTDAGAKLSVRGSGATSATTALRVENSSAFPSLIVLDDRSATFYNGLTITGSILYRVPSYGSFTLNNAWTDAVNNNSISVYDSNGNISLRASPSSFTRSIIIRPSPSAGVLIGPYVTGNGTGWPNILNVSGSSNFIGNITVTGSQFTFISGSSVEFRITGTGVNIGNLITDTHTVTGSLNVSGSITSSLQGTASYATQALSASFAPQTPTFPFTGSAIISGSLVITGSLIVSGANGGIDTVNGYLNDSAGVVSLDWSTGNRRLQDASALDSIKWNDRTLVDSANINSIDWENKILTEGTGTWVALEYSSDTYLNSQLYYRNTIPTQVQRSVADTPAYGGQVIQATVDGAVSDFDLVSLDTDGTWKGVKAAVGYGADKMLGICVDAAGGYVLLEGDVGVSDDDSQGAYVVGADHGLPVYASETTSEMTTTAPSGTGAIVRVVGHIYYQSTSDVNWWTMKFRPSNDWYEI
jgi:hypothetical protein